MAEEYGLEPSSLLLQKHYALRSTFCAHIVGPDGGLHFADVHAPEEEHAESGLSDAAADGEGQGVV